MPRGRYTEHGGDDSGRTAAGGVSTFRNGGGGRAAPRRQVPAEIAIGLERRSRPPGRPRRRGSPERWPASGWGSSSACRGRASPSTPRRTRSATVAVPIFPYFLSLMSVINAIIHKREVWPFAYISGHCFFRAPRFTTDALYCGFIY